MIGEQKFYLTKEWLEKLKKEYEGLKALKMAKTKGEEFPKVLQSEDLNPEYLAFREDMNFLESRILELEEVFKGRELIKVPPKDKRNIVALGSTITVEANRQKDEFTLVGSLEANPSLGRISNESPVGKALLGHRLGEEIAVSSPVKTIYKIKKIKYKTA
jgi:transcription elongation factor GreA